ncbi:MAG TPA: zf-HC2 domain-containing protein [Candidatus Sabulitectum sp.]|nr:zf-HC2 domain-containing protein [Candidatus Sabulitectum sp.]HPF32213.1 zf-HC2 domain-containing protein [Candidatus Sabulitectum sp.]HPJ27364.1 zf-HC2 domain-containing protein [Candidatus Sabulitectum sp.]HPR21079.1 zf-HC2 domain-containing protein [Candidatus Sabulitectum sp.]
MGPECLFVLDNYNDYVSGELDRDSSARVERHISVCPNCETFLGRYMALHGKTVQLLRIPAPTSLKDSIARMMEKA